MRATDQNIVVSAADIEAEVQEKPFVFGICPSSGMAGSNPRLRRLVPDLSQRAHLSELMDVPCSYDDLFACLRDIAKVNRLTFAYRPTLSWLDQLVRHSAATARALRIIDVGCGYGDTLRRVARWASDRNVPVVLTGIDMNPDAIKAAKQATPSLQRIEWLVADALLHSPPDGADIIICSLFTHHLPDCDIVRFLVWLEKTARLGWFISDLHRQPMHYHLFRLFAGIFGWHHFVRHDGPVSIRRSFVLEDWQALCTAAGIALDAISIRRRPPARLCVSRIRPGK